MDNDCKSYLKCFWSTYLLKLTETQTRRK